MEKGIIYVMTTAVPGLIKIGRTGSNNFEQRMYNLEQNGYRNVTGLKREFAIEVEEYQKKESLLDTIFEKSRVSDTELFAVDKNIVVQLLSSFEGKMIFPKDEGKEDVFEEASDNRSGSIIPNGTYYFKRQKKSDGNKMVSATAKVENGFWTVLKGSVLGITEGKGVSQKAREIRETLPLDENGRLLADAKIGECSPSFAGAVVINAANDGWLEWKNKKGEPVDTYRKEYQKKNSED